MELTHEQIVGLFTTTEKFKFDLSKPFYQDGHWYATDGRAIIRWAGSAIGDLGSGPPAVEKFRARSQINGKTVELPTVELPGPVHGCGQCSFCEEDEDMLVFPHADVVELEGVTFSPDYLAAILAMGVTSVLLGGPKDAAFFTVDKYEGLVMPTSNNGGGNRKCRAIARIRRVLQSD